jgi:hypothetical protein
VVPWMFFVLFFTFAAKVLRVTGLSAVGRSTFETLTNVADSPDFCEQVIEVSTRKVPFTPAIPLTTVVVLLTPHEE